MPAHNIDGLSASKWKRSCWYDALHSYPLSSPNSKLNWLESNALTFFLCSCSDALGLCQWVSDSQHVTKAFMCKAMMSFAVRCGPVQLSIILVFKQSIPRYGQVMWMGPIMLMWYSSRPQDIHYVHATNPMSPNFKLYAFYLGLKCMRLLSVSWYKLIWVVCLIWFWDACCMFW
jgi:hypothetical protein